MNLVLLVLALSVIGVFVIGSAEPDNQSRQIIGLAFGLFVMVIVSLIDYVWLMDFYWLIYGFVVLILGAVLVIGTEVNGATRWINLGFTQFQPSELAKILLILFFAKFITEHEDEISEPRTLLKYAVLCGIPLALIIAEPNLSTTICTALVLCLLIYIGGLSYKFIGTVLVILIPVAVIFLSIVVQPNQPFLKDYQQERILAWLEPEKYADDESYQQLNSVMAIGSGQLSGKGYNNDETNSVKNGNFVLEPQTDFIFAIIGEELGFVGCCAVIFLILLIVVDCILIGLKAKDTGGRIICGGMAALIGIQSFINISVATLILPNTGLSLPFVSYGLTSVVCFFMGIGFVLNVGLQPNKYQ